MKVMRLGPASRSHRIACLLTHLGKGGFAGGLTDAEQTPGVGAVTRAFESRYRIARHHRLAAPRVICPLLETGLLAEAIQADEEHRAAR